MDHLDQLETRELEESLVRKDHQGNKADQDQEVELVDQERRGNRYKMITFMFFRYLFLKKIVIWLL